jgi:hypothetical protein
VTFLPVIVEWPKREPIQGELEPDIRSRRLSNAISWELVGISARQPVTNVFSARS